MSSSVARGVGSIALGDRVVAQRTGLELDAELTFTEWAKIGESLGRIADSSAWWIGDWVFYGEWEYGKKYEEALALTGLDEGYLRNLKMVAGKFNVSRRRDNLSISHHAEVTSLGLHEQDEWLDKAEAENLSQKALREAIREARQLGKASPNPIALTIYRLPVDPDREVRWGTAAEREGLELQDWIIAAADEKAGAA